MNWTGRGALAALLALTAMGLSGCDAEGGQDAGPQALTFETWNLGLAYNFVPLALERREMTIAAAASSDADIVCLQEVWTDEDVKALREQALTAGFTEAWYESTPEDVTGLPVACTEGDRQDLQPCAETHCSTSTELANCVQGQCGAELAAVSEACLTCLASNLHLSLAQILLTCGQGGAKYTYGGQSGLLLLSRVPLTQKKLSVLNSTLVRRAVLQASVEAPGGQTLQISCTHLTAALSSVPYSGPKKSWADEQGDQLDELVALTEGAPQALIMGDLNTGPAVGGLVKAEFPDNFAKLTAAGFSSPFMAQEKPLCTFCGDNTLVSKGVDKGGEGVAIDHLLVRGWSGDVIDVERRYDATVTLPGQPEPQHLSDHFGVRMTLSRP